MEIISKNYQHYNRSLGKYISSKREYDNEMARQGMIPYEKAYEISEKVRREKEKPYILSKKAQEIINTARNSADKRGNIKLSDRTIDAMKEMGVKFPEIVNKLPADPTKGGFNAS